MLKKLNKCWTSFRLAIVAGAVTLVYFLGRKRGKENEKAQKNKEILENAGRANKARSSLRNSYTTHKLHDKYKR